MCGKMHSANSESTERINNMPARFNRLSYYTILFLLYNIFLLYNKYSYYTIRISILIIQQDN